MFTKFFRQTPKQQPQPAAEPPIADHPTTAHTPPEPDSFDTFEDTADDLPPAPAAALAHPEAEQFAQRALQAANVPEEARTEALQLVAGLAAAHAETPDDAFWRGALADLRERRLAAAASAIAEALADAHPAEPWPLLELATDPKLAPAAALSVGHRLHRLSPDSPHGPRLILRALRQQGRRAEQAAFFAALPTAFEGHDWYHASGADLAWAEGAFEASLAHAEHLRHLSPNRTTGHTMAIASLRRLKRARDAKPLLVTALAKFPDSLEVLREAALLAQAVCQNDRAFALWDELRQRFPQSPAGFLGAIRLSRRLNQPETMARLVEQGLRAFPGHPALLAAASEPETAGSETVTSEAGEL